MTRHFFVDSDTLDDCSNCGRIELDNGRVIRLIDDANPTSRPLGGEIAEWMSRGVDVQSGDTVKVFWLHENNGRDPETYDWDDVDRVVDA